MTDARRLELAWPGRGSSVEERPNGSWTAGIDDTQVLVGLDASDPLDPNAPVILLVEGQRVSGIAAAARLLRGRVKLAYLDTPRLEIDDAAAAFKGETARRYSEWLTVLEAHLSAVGRLLAEDGVVVVQVGDREEPYARLLLHQLFGPDNYIGTVVWQRHYSARQIPNPKEIHASHDFLLIAAKDRAIRSSVVWKRSPKKLRNTDDDPRGYYSGGHKGARKPDYDYVTNVPPYRWRLLEGALPPGVWRVNPWTGVIWGKELQEPGQWTFSVECRDSQDAVAVVHMTIAVLADGEAPSASRAVPTLDWLRTGPERGGPIRVERLGPTQGVVARPFSTMLTAAGGDPFTGTVRPKVGRYWEWPLTTLEAAIAEDAAVFGVDGNAIPWIKKYSEHTALRAENVYSIWWGREPEAPDGGAGWTENATKHLNALRDEGIIQLSLTTAKPEPLMARLLELFTRPGDWVCEVFGYAGDLSAVAAKLGRSSIYLTGASDEGRRQVDACALPRLRAVAAGCEHHVGDEGAFGFCVEPRGTASVLQAAVSAPMLLKGVGDDFPSLAELLPFNSDAFLVSQGFWPTGDGWGASLDGDRVALVVDPDVYLTDQLSASAREVFRERDASNLTVFYFRSLAEDVVAPDLQLIRLPFDAVL